MHSFTDIQQKVTYGGLSRWFVGDAVIGLVEEVSFRWSPTDHASTSAGAGHSDGLVLARRLVSVSVRLTASRGVEFVSHPSR